MRGLVSRYGYTLLVALVTAMLTFPFRFFRAPPEEVINTLFGAAPFELSSSWSNPSLLVNLAIYVVCTFAFTIIAVGCPIACGVFSPVFLIGAAFGRGFGEILDMATPEERHITAGAYAVVGAAAMAAGVTRTVSCAVMVFELTGQLNHMLPVLVAVLAAYGVGNVFNKSIYDTMLELNNLNPKRERIERRPPSRVGNRGPTPPVTGTYETVPPAAAPDRSTVELESVRSQQVS